MPSVGGLAEAVAIACSRRDDRGTGLERNAISDAYDVLSKCSAAEQGARALDRFQHACDRLDLEAAFSRSAAGEPS